MAIIEWLDETYPTPALLPLDKVHRAKARSFALVLAADTHPLQNLKVLNALQKLGVSEESVRDWAAEVNTEGLEACEALLSNVDGPY